jgi:DNA invertase Pin-like site-specific DNA recombinase
MATAPAGDAAIYTRQSHGKERSIAEQEAAGREACETEGWHVREVYTDTVSASRFARQERPDWDRLLADLEAARFAVLVMWESSRGDREAETWLGLLRRCRDHRVLIHVVAHGRTYDMSRRRDWRTMADDGIDSADESWKISERVCRGLTANAHNGRPHGVTLYGYERIYDSRTRDLVEQREHPVQGPVVREVFAMAERGHPLSRIAADLNDRGIPAPKGGKWTRATVRQLLTNPAYIGKRRAGSTITSRKHTEEFGAIWSAIVDEAVYWKVQNLLSDPARKVTRPGRQKWLLSYLARCAECGAHLSVFRGGNLYGCSENGCTYIRRERLDVYVSWLAVAWVDRYGRDALTQGASGDKAVVEARAEAGRLRAELDALAANTTIELRYLEIRQAALLPQIEAAEKRARQASFQRGLPPGYVFTEDDIWAGWEGAGLIAQRELVKALMVIRVRKPAYRGEFPERVNIEWKKGKGTASTG